jgi:hypothetical protein
MPAQAQAFRWMPWAWSAAWLLTGLGNYVSNSYPSPYEGLYAYLILSVLGWGFASLITARASTGRPGMTFHLVAWGIASLSAILLGLVWMRSWDAGFLGWIAATGLAGAIGGVAGSMRTGVWRWVSGVGLGAAFLLLALISFFGGYLLALGYASSALPYNAGLFYALIMPGPAAVFGLGAGFLARWLLGLSKSGPGFVST